jgi:protein-L-isoaspartate(D-aspartate) O-methyltransferase
MTDFERLRRGMVDCQIRPADVTDHDVISAFLTVPRERFVADGRASLAYLDSRAPLEVAGRAMLEPMTLAKLLQLAAPRAGEKALVVGCGLGYTAALLDELGLEVVALEVAPTLAAEARARLADRAKVTVLEGSLPAGAPDHAPFDLIFCDGAVADGLDSLGRQLAPQGRLVAIAGDGRSTRATVFRPQRSGLSPAPAFDAYGPPLPGFDRAEAFAL